MDREFFAEITEIQVFVPEFALPVLLTAAVLTRVLLFFFAVLAALTITRFTPLLIDGTMLVRYWFFFMFNCSMPTAAQRVTWVVLIVEILRLTGWDALYLFDSGLVDRSSPIVDSKNR